MAKKLTTLVELPIKKGKKQLPGFISASPIQPALGANVKLVEECSVAPYNSIGLLVDGQTGIATTAFLVNSSTIMTAGHCLFRPELGGKNRSFYFALQYSRSQGGLWNRVEAAASLWGWTELRNHRYDLAIAKLDKAYADPLLIMPPDGYQPGKKCQIIGYISGGAQLWQAQGYDLHWNTHGARVSASMSEGCSGGPWLQNSTDKCIVIGLTSQGNDNLLISPAWASGVQELLSWSY